MFRIAYRKNECNSLEAFLKDDPSVKKNILDTCKYSHMLHMICMIYMICIIRIEETKFQNENGLNGALSSETYLCASESLCESLHFGRYL